MVYKKYAWRAGHGNVPAEEAGKVMEQIQERDGEITAESFLDESRAEDSPTHGCFEWDDTAAAEKYRLQQSGACIRDLLITVERTDDEPNRVPAFVNVTSAGKARFQDTQKALSVEESRKVVLENALSELDAFRKKYATLAELSKIFAVIDELKNMELSA